jgi:ribulose-phosphate 3-epimerase
LKKKVLLFGGASAAAFLTGLAVFHLGMLVFIRSGTEAKVPELGGMDEAGARRTLEELGFTAVMDREEHSAEVGEGLILEQRPPAGEVLRKGRKVWLTVSLGYRKAIVPNVAGLTYRQAGIVLDQEELALGPRERSARGRRRSGSAADHVLPRGNAGRSPGESRTRSGVLRRPRSQRKIAARRGSASAPAQHPGGREDGVDRPIGPPVHRARARSARREPPGERRGDLPGRLGTELTAVLHPIQVAPSLLSADFSDLASAVRNVERAGADLLHLDVMDGEFVPNITLGPVVVEAVKRVARRPLDVHLMIREPLRYVDAFARAGADFLTIHVEAASDVAATLEAIRRRGVRPGITLRPGTPFASVEPFLPLVDLVLVMTVEPGFGGQEYMPEQESKLSRARELRQAAGSAYVIEVDGGIGPQTARRAVAAGAEILVAGSALFGSDDIPGLIRSFHELESARTH